MRCTFLPIWVNNEQIFLRLYGLFQKSLMCSLLSCINCKNSLLFNPITTCTIALPMNGKIIIEIIFINNWRGSTDVYSGIISFCTEFIKAANVHVYYGLHVGNKAVGVFVQFGITKRGRAGFFANMLIKSSTCGQSVRSTKFRVT